MTTTSQRPRSPAQSLDDITLNGTTKEYCLNRERYLTPHALMVYPA
jgi:hypothetical protein